MEKKEVDKSSDEDDDENQESDGGQESNLISFRQENDSLQIQPNPTYRKPRKSILTVDFEKTTNMGN